MHECLQPKSSEQESGSAVAFNSLPGIGWSLSYSKRVQIQTKKNHQKLRAISTPEPLIKEANHIHGLSWWHVRRRITSNKMTRPKWAPKRVIQNYFFGGRSYPAMLEALSIYIYIFITLLLSSISISIPSFSLGDFIWEVLRRKEDLDFTFFCVVVLQLLQGLLQRLYISCLWSYHHYPPGTIYIASISFPVMEAVIE